MQHGVYLPPFGAFGDVHRLVDLAVAAEEAGWDGVFLWDHVLGDPGLPLVDAWIALTAIATATSTVRLGPLVTPLPRRRPWKLAREAVTLDHLSEGRLVLGVGLGTDFWREASAFPGEPNDDGERAVLTDDALDVLDRLWSGEPVDHAGPRFRLDDAHFLPRPVQRPRIPLWAAALWPAAKPGPLRRAARCDGIMPFKPEALRPEEAAEVREAVAAHRADGTPFDVCVWGDADRADEYAAAGVTWLVDFVLPDADVEAVGRTIAAGPPR